MKISVVRTHPDAKLPTYGSNAAAGADIYALSFDVDLSKNMIIAHTGLHFEIPVGYGMFLFPRSGLAKKYGLQLVNSVGVIDADYRGELMVMLTSTLLSPHALLEKIAVGDRIAQAVILPVGMARYHEVETLNDTARGHGGFGSTGQS